MKRFHRPFLTLLLSLLLIGTQQAAFAHLLGHLPGGAATVAQYQGDHGAVDQFADNCATCIAFAGIGGGTPPTATAPFSFPPSDRHCQPAAVPVFTRLLITHRARAPPVFL